MAKKTSHVRLRDGSVRLAAERPDSPARPAGRTTAGDPSYFRGSDDPQDIKGSFAFGDSSRNVDDGRSAPCDKAAFEALPGGRPSPRQRAQRGEALDGRATDTKPPDGVSLKPGDPAASPPILD